MKITREYLEKMELPIANGDYILRLGSCDMKIRLNMDHCYCELPGLYVGEITMEQLHCLYFGLTGRTLNERLPLSEQVLLVSFKYMGDYKKYS